MRRRRLEWGLGATSGLVVLGLVAFFVIDAVAERQSWAWKQADLDRNSLNLAISRGAETGPQLADAVEHGEVVAASGTSPHTVGGDAEVVVVYEQDASSWLGGDTGEVERTCYAFHDADGHNVDFERVDCP